MIIGPGDPEREKARAEAAKAERRRAKKARRAAKAQKAATSARRREAAVADTREPVDGPTGSAAPTEGGPVPQPTSFDGAPAPVGSSGPPQPESLDPVPAGPDVSGPPTAAEGLAGPVPGVTAREIRRSTAAAPETTPAPDAIPAVNATPAPATTPVPEATPTPPAPDVTPVLDAATTPDATTTIVDVPPTDDEPAVDPGALVGRIDRLRGRVDALLALVDGAEDEPAGVDPVTDRPEPSVPSGGAAGDPEVPGQGFEPSSLPVEGSGAFQPSAPERPAGVTPSAEPASPSEAPPRGPAPTSGTAALVARELLASGVSREDVLRRLRESYGVAEPEVALRAAG